MGAALHLQYIEKLWAEDGPLQASLREVLGDPPRLKAISKAAERSRIAQRIERDIARLDHLDGDPDFEPDADREPEEDFEPSLGWSQAGAQAQTCGGEDMED